MSVIYSFYLDLGCDTAGCTALGVYLGSTKREAKSHAQRAGWLVRSQVVHCPSCAKASRGTGPQCTASCGPRGRCPNPSTAAYSRRSILRNRVAHSVYARCAQHPMATGQLVPIWWVNPDGGT